MFPSLSRPDNSRKVSKLLFKISDQNIYIFLVHIKLFRIFDQLVYLKRVFLQKQAAKTIENALYRQNKSP